MELDQKRDAATKRTVAGGMRDGGWLGEELRGAEYGGAEALGCLAGPRVGVGDQIRYLR
jgi:hypothetical protein